jgi:hypothetical protein
MVVALELSGALAILSRDPDQLTRLDRDGATIEEVALDFGGTIVHGAFGNDSWYVLAKSGEGNALFRLGEDWALVGYTGLTGRLTVTSDRVLVTQVTRPYTIAALDGIAVGGVASPDLGAVDALVIREDDGRTPLLSMPAVVLGDAGILQVLTDPTSDARVLVRYDGTGTAVQTRMLQAPLGFVGAAVNTNTVTALRKLNREEIIKYRWSWRGVS